MWIVDLLWGFIPQKDDDALRIWEWRWKSVALGLSALILACYASNLFPLVPPPYALASVVTDQNVIFQRKLDITNGRLDGMNGTLKVLVDSTRENQIRAYNTDLIDARRYQCRGINSEDKASLPFWNARLQELGLAYQRLAGIRWRELPCNSF